MNRRGNHSGHRPPQAQSPLGQDTTEVPPDRGEAPVKRIVDRDGRRIEKQRGAAPGNTPSTTPNRRDAGEAICAAGAGEGAQPLTTNNTP